MVNEAAQGIARALQAEFGGAPAARGPVRQGLRGPRFFIACERASRRPYPSHRIRAECVFLVSFLPGQAQEARAACAETAGRLFACLAVIDTDGGPLRGTHMAWTFEDGMLRFSVRYGCFLQAGGGAPKMGALEFRGMPHGKAEEKEEE